MRNQTKQRRSLVLMEIMVALLILGIFTAGLAKTAKGAMEMARCRKSLDLSVQICTALENHLLERGESPQAVIDNWRQIARMSSLVGDRSLKDGWGYDFECHPVTSHHEMVKAAKRSTPDGCELDHFVVVSRGLFNYQKHRTRAP